MGKCVFLSIQYTQDTSHESIFHKALNEFFLNLFMRKNQCFHFNIQC